MTSNGTTDGVEVLNESNSGEPALRVVGLSKHYGAIAALDGCALEVPKGAIVGLIGPNGSGKSTLIEVVSGLATQESGSVFLNGTDISHAAPNRRALLGLCRTFQISRVWRRMSVWENLVAAFPSQGRESVWRTFARRTAVNEHERADMDTTSEVLNELGLWHVRDTLAGQLSGGQLRLVEFGRIMVSGGTVALLDEPLAGINPVMGDVITNVIRRLQQRGITVILVEHNLRVIEDLCPLVFAMHQGRVVSSGTLKALANEEMFAESYMGSMRRPS
jgi:ABC-type branched-subunit amino acid transport system ATPase component